MKNSKPIYIVDASSFIFRAYYALAPLSSKGRPSHAVAGFASMLLKLIRDHQPSSLVVVFDSKKPSFRKDIFAEYKANREVPPPDISDQIVAVMDMCKRGELPILQEEGIEADDWIGTFAKKYESEHPVVIVSSDKDLAQLVDKRISLLDTFRDKKIGPKEVVEKWGVRPDQMRDFLSLTGDTSDNIPGLAGVGPKTASKLLQDYESIEGIYKNLDSLSPKLRQKFEEGREQLKLSQSLVDLKVDMKLPFKTLPEVKFPLAAGLRDFLIEWDCSRALQQYPEILGSGASADLKVEASVGAKAFKKTLVKTQKDLEELQKQIEKAKCVAFDCETTSFNRETAEVCGVSIAALEGHSWYVPWKHGKVDLKPSDFQAFLKKFLTDPKIPKIAHNSKFDLAQLLSEGIKVEGLCHDTMILAHLLYADRRSLSLDNLAKEFLQQEKGDLKGLLKGSENFSEIALEEALEYAAQDAALTYQLFNLFYPELKKNEKLEWLYSELELPLVSVLAAMEAEGVELNTQHLQKLSKELHKELLNIESKIFKVVGHEFNIASPKQLQVVLFEELGLPPLKKTKTGFSTDERVLTELSLQHEVPKLILDQRRLAKLTSTYVDVLPEMVWKKDGRLHTHYHQTGTATGRLSSSEPNLQNIPIRSEEGTKIRRAFVAKEGWELFSADYSQVELRLMAHFADDPKMIETFKEGGDIHSETAKEIFGSGDKEFRSKAKAINFGVIYGISAFGLSQQLGISRGEAKEFIDSYFERFPKVKEYMDASIKKVKKALYSETLFGRRRPLPDIQSKNPTLRQMAERMAINAPLQGTAADIMKWAMLRVAKDLEKKKLKSKLLLQVHDELILELAPGEEEPVRELVQDCMTNLKGTPGEKLKVPLVVDSSVGESWAEI